MEMLQGKIKSTQQEVIIKIKDGKSPGPLLTTISENQT